MSCVQTNGVPDLTLAAFGDAYLARWAALLAGGQQVAVICVGALSIIHKKSSLPNKKAARRQLSLLLRNNQVLARVNQVACQVVRTFQLTHADAV